MPAEQELDLGTAQTVHIVGLGGSIMSAFAAVLVRMGHRVSGSDLRDSRALERLRALGVDARVGHDAANVPDAVDAVIASTAIARSNPELRRAYDLGVPVFSRADTQRAMVALRRTVAVAGSHGKTTTSSMLALILREAGWHPSFLIGGDLNEVGTNASWDDGEWLVVEADESDGTFLEFAPEAAVVTNVEPDHLTHWGDFPALVAGFERFLADVPGPRIVSADDTVAAELARRHDTVVTFGFAEDADYGIRDYAGKRSGSQFVVERRGERLGVVELPVPGRHNAKNAAAATATATEIGVPFEAVRRALGAFGGVARRFQFRGERHGVTFVDDYAHLPGEVSHMIDAAREGDWAHVIVVFQPHRYTRTAALWRDFAHAFAGADTVVLTDVYGFNETPQPGVSGRLILHAVLDAHPEQPVVYLPRRADLVEHVPKLARAGDVVLTLGAGDLTTVPDEWLALEGVTAVATNEVIAHELERALPGAVERDAPFAALTTYHLGGPAAVLVRVPSLHALAAVAGVVRDHAPPILVVGRGSNLLVADGGFDGLAIVLTGAFEQVDLDSAPGVARAGGAVPLPVLARRAAAAGRGGLEFFVGIPGSVGGAVRMNAGGHGRETAEVLVRAFVVDLEDGASAGSEIARTAAELELGYRRSAVGPFEVVTRAEFVVEPAPAAACEAAIAEIVRWRRQHQPGGSNAGSVFRNPPGDSAGRIIDEAGLKGLRVGGAVVSPKHANFFQAEPGARADDVYRLVREVQRRVLDATGATLETELRLVGFEGGS